jgi:hypothetical protein
VDSGQFQTLTTTALDVLCGVTWLRRAAGLNPFVRRCFFVQRSEKEVILVTEALSSGIYLNRNWGPQSRESGENIPQGLKPISLNVVFGTTEVVL